MRRAPRRYGHAAPVALAPLLDVTTILLVFALLVGGERAGDAVELPVASAAPAADGAVEVTISARGVSLDGELVVPVTDPAAFLARATEEPLPALLEALAARAAALDDGGPRELVVRADRGLPFAAVRAVMITAGRAGFRQFRLIVAEGRRRRRPRDGGRSGSCMVRPAVLPGSGALDYVGAGPRAGAEPPNCGGTRGTPKTMTRHQRNAARRERTGETRTLGVSR